MQPKAHRQLGATEGHAAVPVGDRRPLAIVAIDHPMMRALTSELLEREGVCRVTAMGGDDRTIADAIVRDHPDLVILDTGEFPACFPAALRLIPSALVLVIGPEPAGSYRTAALAAGAGAWISCDRVGDDLMTGVRQVLDGGADPPPPALPGSPAVDSRP